MKKILIPIITLIFVGIMIPQDRVSAYACPWTTGGDNLAVELTQSVLFSNNDPRQNTTAVNIPAGTYNVFGYTYDAHSAHGGQNQPYEKVYFSFRNEAGTVLANTPATSDIPENSDVIDTILGSITLSDTTKTIYSIHAVQGQGNYQSVYPVCLLLQRQSPPAQTLEVSCSASPSNPEIGETVNWNASPSGGTGSYTYNWTGSITGTTKSPSTSYNSTGTKTSTVTVVSGSQTKTATCSVNVQEEDDDNNGDDLEVECQVDDRNVEVGEEIKFEAKVSGGDSPYEYDWDFDDGEDGDKRIEYHEFDDEGTYEVKVTVEDDDGNKATDYCPVVKVDEEEDDDDDDLEIECRVSDTKIEEGDTVEFRVDIDGGNSPYEIEWKGDIEGDDETEKVRFNRSGRYEVKVYVEDDDGNEDSDVCPIVVVDDEDRKITTSVNYNYPTGQLAGLNSVLISQVPYTGPEDVAKVIGIISFTLVWSIIVGLWLKKRRAVIKVSNKISEFKERNKQATKIS